MQQLSKPLEVVVQLPSSQPHGSKHRRLAQDGHVTGGRPRGPRRGPAKCLRQPPPQHAHHLMGVVACDVQPHTLGGCTDVIATTFGGTFQLVVELLRAVCPF